MQPESLSATDIERLAQRLLQRELRRLQPQRDPW